MENGTHEFDLQKLESDPEHISKTKLYKIMKDQILRVLRGKKGEKEVNIIFSCLILLPLILRKVLFHNIL